MMRKLARYLLLLCSLTAVAQTSPCGAPVPGSPHICLTWVASTTSGVTYNVYRATTAGGENYSTPLNTSAITGLVFSDVTDAIGTTYFYTTCAVGKGGVLSPPSNEVQAQAPVPPNSPTGETATPY